MDPVLESYILQHSTPEDPLLAELYQKTWQEMMNPRMAAGHVQGRLLSFISSMVKPLRVLEIGTFTGYSALCLAGGLANGGLLDTIEKDDELVEFAQSFIARSERKHQITIHTGDALDIIPGLRPGYDLVFIDGEKTEYPAYYELVMRKIKPGGFILADNVLWNGKVLEPGGKQDKATIAMLEFNRMVTADRRVENVLLPLRDGLMLVHVREHA